LERIFADSAAWAPHGVGQLGDSYELMTPGDEITLVAGDADYVSILITAATHSHKSPPPVLTDRRHPIALNAATRSRWSPPAFYCSCGHYLRAARDCFRPSADGGVFRRQIKVPTSAQEVRTCVQGAQGAAARVPSLLFNMVEFIIAYQSRATGQLLPDKALHILFSQPV